MNTTKYYFYETNAGRGILATNNIYYYDCGIDSNGNDINTNINIYDSDIETIQAAYKKLLSDGVLYTFDDIARDFSDKVFLYDSNDYKKLTLIIEF